MPGDRGFIITNKGQTFRRDAGEVIAETFVDFMLNCSTGNWDHRREKWRGTHASIDCRTAKGLKKRKRKKILYA